MSTLSITIARNANIAALVAERPGLALLQRLQIESSPRRRWQRDDHITHDLQISLMGKTGYGKSTFANTFCGQKLLGTSAVAACTRTAQSYEFAINPGNYLSVVDLPGMGESNERDTGFCTINPASGLPMIGDDCGGIDVAGNPFGTDLSDFSGSVDDTSSHSTDSDWSSSTSFNDDWCSSSDDWGSSSDDWSCSSSFDSDW